MKKHLLGYSYWGSP